MSTQNKMSIKQVIRQEYKLIGLFSIIAILLPIISEAIFVSDLVQFKGLSALEKIGALLGVSDYAFTDVSIITNIGMFIAAVAIPVFAVIMARKLNGQSLKLSIKDGLKDISSKKFWMYIGKVYVPFVIIVLAVIVAVGFVPETFTLNILSSLLSSTAALIVAIILVIIISVLVTSIAGMIYIANVVYFRGSYGIKASFKAIPSRESNKLIIFNAVESIIGVLIVVGYVVVVMSLSPTSFISNIVSFIIALVITLMVYQVIFIFFRFSIYMNIASKVAVDAVIVEYQSKAKSKGASDQAKQAVELSIKPKGANRIKNKHIDNSVELSIKPKGANRSKLINEEQLSANKPKRAIK